MTTNTNKKFIHNPHKNVSLYAGEIIGVWVDKDDSVTWSGYNNQDGSFVVTGYAIIKNGDKK